MPVKTRLVLFTFAAAIALVLLVLGVGCCYYAYQSFDRGLGLLVVPLTTPTFDVLDVILGSIFIVLAPALLCVASKSFAAAWDTSLDLFDLWPWGGRGYDF